MNRVMANNGPRFSVTATTFGKDRNGDTLALTFSGKEQGEMVEIDVLVPAPAIVEDLTDYLPRIGIAFLLAARTLSHEFEPTAEEVGEDVV